VDQFFAHFEIGRGLRHGQALRCHPPEFVGTIEHAPSRTQKKKMPV
jgi:hypothetical protein